MEHHALDIGIQIELHSVQGIKRCFENGIDPNQTFKGKPLIEELIGEYTRTPRFKDCVKAFVEYGLQFDDDALLAVLTDDSALLEKAISKDLATDRRYTLPCAYTPLEEVSLLHVCAEFNHLSCASILVKNHADVDAVAGKDQYGFGGQTPVFHTVNQNGNQSKQMLEFLIQHSVNLSTTVQGLIWGKGYPWETVIPSVNPISYAMMGLLPQMHRSEKEIGKTVSLLIRELYGINYVPRNIPNAYLNS